MCRHDFYFIVSISSIGVSFYNFNRPVHTIVISSMIIFLKTLKLLHIGGLTGPTLGSTVNTSTFKHCYILLLTVMYAAHINYTWKNFRPFWYICNRLEYRISKVWKM
jgi:hypothetical protein